MWRKWIAVELALVCLHVDGFSQSRGQRLGNMISFFASFVSVCEVSEPATQESNFHDNSFSPTRMATFSKVVAVTLNHGHFPLNCIMKPVIHSCML